MASAEDLVQMFMKIGLSEQKSKETLKNTGVTNYLKICIDAASSNTSGEISNKQGTLLYNLATKVKAQIADHIPFLTKYIVSDQINSETRLAAAMDYLMLNPIGEVKTAAFEESCGVGVTVTDADIEREVKKALEARKDDIVSKRYNFNRFLIMTEVRNLLKWAEGSSLKKIVDMQVDDMLGPKTESDLAPVPKTGKAAKPAKSKAPSNDAVASGSEASKDEVDSAASTMSELMKKIDFFHKPGENFTTDGYIMTDKTMDLLAAHKRETGGQVRTRFPPEPNGILHIGHAKAININFGYAAAHNGTCYLRYDDTNPEKEEEKFFTGIRDMVEWLGYKPDKITHSSDNFKQLYKWAKVLILKGLAYVCHQKAEEMKGFNPVPSPWRDRPVEESLNLFKQMKYGMFDEGAATLRMKTVLEEGKMDPVAYRIKYVAHHVTKDKWCIYPTYDYTHCLCDSLEHITHSLCTKEFQSRRSSYYWLCNALDIYCPVQWEYGRLNVNYTVVSKRKIAKLITEKIVADWDDPRLFTLTALRRRGFPPEAINNFCARMGLTGAQAVVDPQMLEAVVRETLNVKAPRTMVVLSPLKVIITDFPHDSKQVINVADFPSEPERGSHSVNFDRVVYIDRSDFREVDEKGYKRMTPNQTVTLRYTGIVIKFISSVKDSAGQIVELHVACVPPSQLQGKPGVIHWVSEPVPVQVRLYERLFRHKNPEDTNEVPAGFLSDVNLDSLTTVDALADSCIRTAKVYDKFQFERVGFFSVDPDSTADKLVFNRTVMLKEDSGKV